VRNLSEEKIAIHCPTKELWRAVESKAFKHGHIWADNKPNERFDGWNVYKNNACILPNQIMSQCELGFLTRRDYTIIPASEYLKEEVFKVGDRVECVKADRVECVKADSVIDVGDKGEITIEEGKVPCVKWDKGGSRWMVDTQLKLINKPKTEDNMNISDNIAEVFENTKEAKKVAARFAGQYGNTDRDLLALRRDKKDLLAIIKKEEDEAKKDK
jgi:hypothetical protein